MLFYAAEVIYPMQPNLLVDKKCKGKVHPITGHKGPEGE
jgi:hypothetical protein